MVGLLHLMKCKGAIGRGVVPAVLRHIGVEKEKVLTLGARDEEKDVADSFGVKFQKVVLSEENYKEVLTPLLKSGDIFVNCSACVSSIDVILLCQQLGVIYADSSNETWDDSPDELHLTWGRYISKEKRLEKKEGLPTALMSHGANPGMVNHFVKHGLMVIAREEYGEDYAVPNTQEEWAQLAKKLEVQLIQISERDTQVSKIRRKPGEFWSTWCPSAFRDESTEEAQVPLGTHEYENPIGNRPESRVLKNPACSPTWFSGNKSVNNMVRSWNPVCGPFLANMTPHDETFSVTKYLTPKDGSYRPTMYFAYQPSNDGILSMRDWLAIYPEEPASSRAMMDDIAEGVDAIGVLICRKGRNRSLWYGSLLDVKNARSLLKGSSATTLSVVMTLLAGLVWVIKNPSKGFVEPDDVDYREILPIIIPYISPMATEWTDWTPCNGEVPEDCWNLHRNLSDATK